MVGFVAHAPEFINGGERCDVLILGSSLMLAPSLRMGDFSRRQGLYGSPDIVVHSSIYERALQACSGRQLQIENLAVPGSMLSDQHLIWQEFLRHRGSGAVPLLVLTVSPRDFQDNTVGRRYQNSPVQQVFSCYRQLHCFWPENFTQAALQSYLRSLGQFQRLVFRLIRTDFADFFCHQLSRPLNLWSGSHGPAHVQSGEQDWAAEMAEPVSFAESRMKVSKSLAEYGQRYRPADWSSYSVQKEELQRILGECRAAGIAVVVVNMPVSRDNMAVLDPAQGADLAQWLPAAALAQGASYLDLNNGGRGREPSMFADSCHLNRNGSQCFVSEFSAGLASSSAFKRAFPGREP